MLLLGQRKRVCKGLADVTPTSSLPANVSTVSRDFPETRFFHMESSICGSDPPDTAPRVCGGMWGPQVQLNYS